MLHSSSTESLKSCGLDSITGKAPKFSQNLIVSMELATNTDSSVIQSDTLVMLEEVPSSVKHHKDKSQGKIKRLSTHFRSTASTASQAQARHKSAGRTKSNH